MISMCRICGRPALQKYEIGHLCQECRRKLLSGEIIENRARCPRCGSVLVHGQTYCGPCQKKLAKVLKVPVYCVSCRGRETCPDHGREIARKCTRCGKWDKCNATRGGLCLDCYASDWCKAHPIKAYDPGPAAMKGGGDGER